MRKRHALRNIFDQLVQAFWIASVDQAQRTARRNWLDFYDTSIYQSCVVLPGGLPVSSPHLHKNQHDIPVGIP